MAVDCRRVVRPAHDAVPTDEGLDWWWRLTVMTILTFCVIDLLFSYHPPPGATSLSNGQVYTPK